MKKFILFNIIFTIILCWCKNSFAILVYHDNGTQSSGTKITSSGTCSTNQDCVHGNCINGKCILLQK